MTASTLTTPDPEDALALVENALERKALLTLVGQCEVNYDGRASSYLPPGDRLVILKPDGTLLVHRDEQRKPVNWQPPGCTHTARLDHERLVIESTRTTPHEEVTIIFETLMQTSWFELDDSSTLALSGSEEDLRQRILADPDILEDGFQAMMTERETPAGPVDIYGKDTRGTPTVVELKRRRVGPDAVGQLSRYVEALDRDLPTDRPVRGILVVPSVTDRAEKLLATEELEFVSLTTDGAESSQSTRLTEFGDE